MCKLLKKSYMLSNTYVTEGPTYLLPFNLLKVELHRVIQGLLKEHVLLLITIELAPSFSLAMIEMYLLKYVLINVKLRSYDIINSYNFNLKSIMWH